MNVRQLIISVVFKGDTAKVKKFENAVDRLKTKTKSLKGPLGAVQGLMSRMGFSLGNLNVKALLATAGLGTIVLMLKRVSEFITRVTSEFQMLNVQMEVMLNSAEKAKKMIQEIRSVAAKTPFTLTGLAQVVKTLLNYRVAAKDALGVMKNLGDIALGNQDKMKLLAIALGQVNAAGRLQGQELRQFVNAAFNPLLTLERLTGVSIGKFRKLMEDGKLSAEAIFFAVRKATEEGGLFFGGMEKGSKTLIGKWSTFLDSLEQIGRTVGGLLAPFLVMFLDLGTSLLRILDPVLKILGVFLLKENLWILALGALVPVLTTLLNGLAWLFDTILSPFLAALKFAGEFLANVFKPIIDFYNKVFTRDFSKDVGPSESQKLADQKMITNITKLGQTVTIEGVDTNNAEAVGEAVRSQFALSLRQLSIGALT